MKSEEIDIDYLRTWIGKQDHAADTLTPELLTRYRATLSGHTELGAAQIPLGIHWCLAPPAVPHDDLGIDGHPTKGAFLPPVPLPRRMWASSKLRFLTTPIVDTVIERSSTVADIELKKSTRSGPLIFVQVDHHYTQNTGQGSETLLTEQQTIVYREPATFRHPTPQKPDDNSANAITIVPDSRLLFRYSALTFNAHRIHYDNHYATAVEGYPGLVVHGPLIATLLMNLAQAREPNTALQNFEFRAIAPTFVDQALQLVIHDDPTESLQVQNHQHASIMTASAGFAENNDN